MVVPSARRDSAPTAQHVAQDQHGPRRGGRCWSAAMKAGRMVSFRPDDRRLHRLEPGSRGRSEGVAAIGSSVASPAGRGRRGRPSRCEATWSRAVGQVRTEERPWKVSAAFQAVASPARGPRLVHDPLIGSSERAARVVARCAPVVVALAGRAVCLYVVTRVLSVSHGNGLPPQSAVEVQTAKLANSSSPPPPPPPR